jgi:FkbM family methyltransferase
MSYSQGKEEQWIKDYFGSHIGNVLDLGANDGKTFSNSLACIERGWGAVCVEPSPSAFDKLFDLHITRDNVECYNVGISNVSGHYDFYDSGTHLKNGDTALLSTFKKLELKRWEGSENEFRETMATLITIPQLLAMTKIQRFDLISIDCEGLDYEILSQMALHKLGCRMLIVETNSVENQKYIDYCYRFGMNVLHKNAENLVFAI